MELPSLYLRMDKSTANTLRKFQTTHTNGQFVVRIRENRGQIYKSLQSKTA